jgi:hypothetical protein
MKPMVGLIWKAPGIFRGFLYATGFIQAASIFYDDIDMLEGSILSNIIL